MNFPRMNHDDYISDIINVFFSLPDQFSSEDEYRFFKHGPGTIQLGKAAIKEVIVGYAMNNANKTDLIRTVNESLPDADILESELNQDTGEVTIRPLSSLRLENFE